MTEVFDPKKKSDSSICVKKKILLKKKKYLCDNMSGNIDKKNPNCIELACQCK